MNEILLLIAGAVAGVIAQGTYTLTRRRAAQWIKTRTKRHHARLDNPALHGRSIIEYFENSGRTSELYRPTHLRIATALPLLSDKSEQFLAQLDFTSDTPFHIDNFDRQVLPVDDALVAQKSKRGAKIWDGTSLYAKKMQRSPGARNVLAIGICNYYSYVTIAQRIRRETGSSRGSKELISRHLSSFDHALDPTLSPIAIAASTSCVFDHGDHRLIALQRRSDEVVTATGLVGVAPIFGLEGNVSESGRSKYGLMTYNFVKEFAEEFFGLEHVILAASSPRADVDWILSLPEVASLVDEIESGRLTLICTGAAIDISDASLTFTLLAHFKSEAYFNHVQQAATGSWESAPAVPGKPAISFIRLDDTRIDDMASIDNMDPSSIMSIDLARRYFGLR